MTTRVKYGIWGCLFGILFPLIGTAIEMIRLEIPFSFGEIAALQFRTPLLLIIDTAPIFLGVFACAIGIATEKLVYLQRKEKIALQTHNDELEKRNADLKELNSMLDGLVYTASHDLKTPVINFKSLLSMLKKMREKPNSEAMIDSIIEKLEKATDKFQVTLADLLDISRLERQFGEDFTGVDVQKSIDSAMDSISEMAKAKNASIQLDLTGPTKIWFSQSNLESILVNLLSNALKYASPKRTPEILVKTRINNENLVLEVKDNGLGMDMEVAREKLFKMFTRLHSQAEGSGIGLYIVKRTVEKCNGKVEFESQVDVGTLFRIILPIHQDKWENSAA